MAEALVTVRKINNLDDVHCVRDAGDSPLQTATISECRYRWLRVPATTFVIVHSPSRSNHRDGFGFSEERGGPATEHVWLRPRMTESIENDMRHLLSTKHPATPLTRTHLAKRAGTAD